MFMDRAADYARAHPVALSNRIRGNLEVNGLIGIISLGMKPRTCFERKRTRELFEL